MDEHLQREILNRLDRDDSVKDPIANLIVSALRGEVEACLAGKPPSRIAPSQEQAAEPVRAYVESITVEGFRGIGPVARLSLRGGPGLTLIVGRNGSGKSSFSEALELLLTGDNQRWGARRARIWREGWRNLHRPEVARIEAQLVLDGRSGPYTVMRTWNAGQSLETGEATVLHNGESSPLDSLGWAQPLATYRPFLSYNELSSMLEEGPAKLFDALASILGLEDLLVAADDLRDTRISRTKIHKAVVDKVDVIRKTLVTLQDERAAQCLEALERRPWDLDRLAALARDGGAGEEDSEIQVLRELANLNGPEAANVQAAVNGIRSALSFLNSIAHADTGKARLRAEILEKALELHQHDGGADCPVCGGALKDEWRREAGEAIRKLRADSEVADAAHRNLLQAERVARQWITAHPQSVTDTKLLSLWNAWRAGATKTGNELAAHLETHAPGLDRAIQEVREISRAELRKREDLWRPIAEALAEWLPAARKMSSELTSVSSLKSAEDWLRTTATSIHNERFLPIKERVKRIWGMLRTQSHVELEDITFQGRSTSRRVSLGVTVDGRPGAALGIMSQGELHSLALALFLPRATLEHSPFRFLLIDDPVQSMDAARVEGLARVLELVAKKRQVVIFTHDDRLTEALRRLHIEAQVVEVLRRDSSVVELRQT
ncbi:MAG TPA: AAA family ATPase [Terriglobia bacterium]|nr:AAA family ATPase [Terriglobia bacterium]